MFKKYSSLNYVLPIVLSLSACAKRAVVLPEDVRPSYEGAVIQESEVTQETVEGASESYGPGLPDESASSATEPFVEEAPPAQDPKLCLILGPGMAKALAQAAVLEAIRKASLPVHCVVGTEMGAVVGALYSASNGNTNSLQWQLFKFNTENYFNFPMISLRDPKSSGKKLHQFLREMFRRKKIEELPIRFATMATAVDSGATAAFSQGDLADALSATLAMPNIFDAWKVDGVFYSSGAVSSPAPLDLARSLGGNFLVLVDVVEDNSGAPKNNARFQKAFFPVRNLIRLQKREASFVIQVRAGAIPFDDFSRQGEILAAGSRAAERSVPELKAAWEKWIAGHK